MKNNTDNFACTVFSSKFENVVLVYSDNTSTQEKSNVKSTSFSQRKHPDISFKDIFCHRINNRLLIIQLYITT